MSLNLIVSCTSCFLGPLTFSQRHIIWAFNPNCKRRWQLSFTLHYIHLNALFCPSCLQHIRVNSASKTFVRASDDNTSHHSLGLIMQPVELSGLSSHGSNYIMCQVSQSSITAAAYHHYSCLLYTSPSPRDRQKSRMPSSA